MASIATLAENEATGRAVATIYGMKRKDIPRVRPAKQVLRLIKIHTFCALQRGRPKIVSLSTV